MWYNSGADSAVIVLGSSLTDSIQPLSDGISMQVMCVLEADSNICG